MSECNRCGQPGSGTNQHCSPQIRLTGVTPTNAGSLGTQNTITAGRRCRTVSNE
jgi:hypothetical protein